MNWIRDVIKDIFNNDPEDGIPKKQEVVEDEVVVMLNDLNQTLLDSLDWSLDYLGHSDSITQTKLSVNNITCTIVSHNGYTCRSIEIYTRYYEQTESIMDPILSYYINSASEGPRRVSYNPKTKQLLLKLLPAIVDRAQQLRDYKDQERVRKEDGLIKAMMEELE